MIEDLVSNFEKFRAGDQDAYWKFICHPNIQKIIDGQALVTARCYRLSAEDVLDFKSDLLLGLIRRMNKFKVDENCDVESKAKMICSFLKLVLMGESDRAARVVKGTVCSDESGNSFFKGFKHSLEPTAKEIEEDRFGDVEKIFDLKSKTYDSSDADLSKAIRKFVFDYLNDRFGSKAYQIFNEYFEEDQCWPTIKTKLNLTEIEKNNYQRDVLSFCASLKAMLSTNSHIKMKVNTLGIYCTESCVVFCLIDEKYHSSMWSSDYFTDQELSKIEAKLGDYIRESNLTWAVINVSSIPNQAEIVLSRVLGRRNIITEKIDITELIPMITNIEELKKKKRFDDIEANAWILAASKAAECNIVRRI